MRAASPPGVRWLLLAGLVCACANGGHLPGDDDDSVYPDATTPALDARAESAPLPDAESPPDARPDAAPCVEGDQNLISDDHCYMWFDRDAEWSGAVSACEAIAAHLVTIDREAENSLVHGLIHDENAWLGASDLVLEGSWVWANGEGWAFNRWESGQPDNGSGTEDCAFMRPNGLWNDDQCGHGVRYVCERE